MAAASPDDGAQTGNELLDVEWFGDVVVGAGIDALDALGPRAPRRQDQDRGLDVAGAEAAHDREAVELGQSKVEHDGRIVFRSTAKPGFLPVRDDLGNIARVGKGPRDVVRDLPLVLNHQHTHQRLLISRTSFRRASTVISR
jgi:hypothetical protein